MKARGIFYGALMAAFWFSVPFAFSGHLLPLVIAVLAMVIATAAAAIGGKHHVV